MKPLLAHIYEPHRVIYPCYVQPKLNGIRALYQNEHFQSRDEQVFSPAVLRHLSEPLKQIFGPEVILDGELYVHGWPLQRINGAVTPVRQQPNADSVQVEYHVFDVVDFGKTFEERRKPLPALDQDIILSRVPYMKVRCVNTSWVTNEAEANREYNDWVNAGYEGMMYRLGDCPYTVPKQTRQWLHSSPTWHTRTKFLSDKHNRCWHLLKRKNWLDDEFDFISIRRTYGDKGEPGFIMTLKSKSRTKPTFDVGSGLTDAEAEQYLENPPVGRQVKVKYLVLSSDGIPLNPTILAIL